MAAIDLAPLKSALKDQIPQGRSALLPTLHLAQSIYGYLPEPVAEEIGRTLDVPLADVYGVIEFYSMFYDEPVGETVLRVCGDPTCALRGSDAVQAALGKHLNISTNQVSKDGAYSLERAPCLGFCEHAPVVKVGESTFGNADPKDVSQIISWTGEPKSIVGGDLRLLTANCNQSGPTMLDEYISSGGYSGLRKTHQMKPEEVISTLKASGLVGRGGAAFPTGLKLESAASTPGEPKYIICNADESEPGTFKDRILMEEDPHRMLEGMLIAAYAIGAQRGYIYLRGEYPHAFKILEAALEETRAAGHLGNNGFDIELRLGAGAYICGEETALFESIEGKRGFPRIKPPFPTMHGLFGKPTVINNVETLCNLPYIIEHGAVAYRQLGTEKSPGTKLFCVSGDVARPGLYEVPFGVTLRHLVFDLAGGMRTDQDLLGMLIGGAAGVFTDGSNLNRKLSFEDLQAAGLPLGSGVVMVFDQSRDMRDITLRLARFFAHESCGKCYPCQLGTQRQSEILARIAGGGIQPGDRDRLKDIGWTMRDASLCGLGQTAATAVLSAVELWPDLFSVDGGGG